MQPTMRPLYLTVLAAILLVMGALACTQVRETTYPRNFTYMPRDEVRDTMRAIAVQVNALDDTLRAEAMDPAEKQESVTQLLTAIEGAASSLQGSSDATNHWLLDENLGRFLADVRQARQAAQAEPPSYMLAGNVTGACRYCHGPR